MSKKPFERLKKISDSQTAIFENNNITKISEKFPGWRILKFSYTTDNCRIADETAFMYPNICSVFHQKHFHALVSLDVSILTSASLSMTNTKLLP